MAQHDYNIANQSGADFRSDLNDALSAIASTNSGDTAPATTFANQLWIDTANNLLKIRNEANSAWITTGIDITTDNSVDINAGTIDGITSLEVSGNATINGDLKVLSAGTVLVGTTSTTIDSSNFGINLTAVGRIKNSVNVAGGGVVTQMYGTAGEFRVKGDGDAENTNNSYGAISDQRLKENIADATPKLEKLKQVQVKTFNLIDHDLKQIGVIAQELESVFPSLVKDNDDGYKTVKYSVFVPILIKAIQELEQQVADLTQRLDGE